MSCWAAATIRSPARMQAVNAMRLSDSRHSEAQWHRPREYLHIVLARIADHSITLVQEPLPWDPSCS
jgi:hypothetical protein